MSCCCCCCHKPGISLQQSPDHQCQPSAGGHTRSRSGLYQRSIVVSCFQRHNGRQPSHHPLKHNYTALLTGQNTPIIASICVLTDTTTTLCSIKKPLIFEYNSRISWSFLAPVETGMNTPLSHVIYLLN